MATLISLFDRFKTFFRPKIKKHLLIGNRVLYLRFEQIKTIISCVKLLEEFKFLNRFTKYFFVFKLWLLLYRYLTVLKPFLDQKYKKLLIIRNRVLYLRFEQIKTIISCLNRTLNQNFQTPLRNNSLFLSYGHSYIVIRPF